MQSVTWQETQSSLPVTEEAAFLWSGEVILNSGKGVSGPFCISKSAAASWAHSTAEAMPADDVFGVQVAGFVCARSKVSALLDGGNDAFRSLNRMWVSPVRSTDTEGVEPEAY